MSRSDQQPRYRLVVRDDGYDDRIPDSADAALYETGTVEKGEHTHVFELDPEDDAELVAALKDHGFDIEWE